MADSFEYKKISNKQNAELFFSDKEEEKKKTQTHAKQTGDAGQEKEEKPQEIEEHFQRLSEIGYDDDQVQKEYRFVEGPRLIERRRQGMQKLWQNTRPTCGCGHPSYSNNKTLYYHIEKHHGGIAPPGTIIGYFKAKCTYVSPADHRARLEVHQVSKNNRDEDYDYAEGSEFSEGNAHSQLGSQQSERGQPRSQPPSNSRQVKQQIYNTRLNRGPVVCSICNTIYNSKWAFNLHFMIKHPTAKQGDKPAAKYNVGRRALPSELQRPFKCRCGKEYTHTSALRLHIRKKHNGYYIEEQEELNGLQKVRQNKEIIEHLRTQRLEEKRKNGQQEESQLQEYSQDSWHLDAATKFGHENRNRPIALRPITEGAAQKIHKCGCGRTYSCSSALGLHIRRKHRGIFLPGTQGAPKYFLKQKKTFESELEKPSFAREINKCGCGSSFNSSNFLDRHIQAWHEGVPPAGTIKRSIELTTGDNQRKTPNERDVFKCGCGRTYSCHGSLRLHIQRHHHFVAPFGTIDGQRIIQTPKQFNNPCSICGTRELGSHFKCLTCASHRICSKCFWGGSYFSAEHEWVRKAEGE